MARVTSKVQVTVPKEIANQLGIRPGDEIEFVPGTDYSVAVRLRLFDLATQRQREREEKRGHAGTAPDRGWRREDLYTRGLPD